MQMGGQDPRLIEHKTNWVVLTDAEIHLSEHTRFSLRVHLSVCHLAVDVIRIIECSLPKT